MTIKTPPSLDLPDASARDYPLSPTPLIVTETETLQRIRRELRGAREVQDRLPPAQLPRIEGIDYYGACQPAGELGGDFFDFVPYRDHCLRLSIGDVSGHGIGAAIITSGLQASLRSLSAQGGGNLAGIVEALNRSLCDISPDNLYATLFYAQIDPVRRQLRYVSAGQEPALIVRRSSPRLRRLESTGTVLGLTVRARYRQKTLLLEPGDLLVTFTDGITEASSPDGDEFREEGVLRVLERHPEAGAAELGTCILEAVDEFRRGSPFSDDRTVVVVRMLDITAKQPTAEHVEEFALAAA